MNLLFQTVVCIAMAFAEVDTEDDEVYDIQRRVIGGQRAHTNQFPYAAALKGDFPLMRKTMYCGASIIGQTWLITAAHCFCGKTTLGDT